MEYLSKPEVMTYLDGIRKDLAIQGKDGDTVTTIIKHLNSLYTYRPTLQAQWIRKKEQILCSRCGFQTLVYKNSPYCPNCGRSMANGRAYDKR